MGSAHLIALRVAAAVLLPLASSCSPFPTTAAASTSKCPQHYFGGLAPVAAQGPSDGVELCRTRFAVLHSAERHQPLWAAEALDAASVRSARRTERASPFLEDPDLNSGVADVASAAGGLSRRPVGEIAGRVADAAKAGATLEDYRRSRYDRGHLAPSGDMPDPSSQAESFYLSNIVPQNGPLNRGPWAELESDVRNLALRHGVVYVVTGTTFGPGKETITPASRLVAPATMWKAVAVRGRGAVVVSADNVQNAVFRAETVAQFTARTGISPFPGASAVTLLPKLPMDLP